MSEFIGHVEQAKVQIRLAAEKLQTQTPYLTRVADAVRAHNEGEFSVNGGATFGKYQRPNHTGEQLPINVSCYVKTTNDMSRGTIIGSVEVVVWGCFTFNEATDNAASVVIRWDRWREADAYTKATRWNGNTHENMPDGARRKVADAVRDVVVAAIGDDIDALASETHWREGVAEKLGALSQASRELDKATRPTKSIEWPRLTPADRIA